jgi:thioredoxin 1
MPWIAIILICLFCALLIYQLSILWQAKRQVGQQAPILDDTADAPTFAPLQLLYFHSPSCGPCRSMGPIIDELSREHENVISVDITQNMVLAQKYNVRATPTVVLVKEGRIAEVLLGPKSATKLRGLLS